MSKKSLFTDILLNKVGIWQRDIGKGKQPVPRERIVRLGFPGGGGYGDPKDRDPELIKRDLARGYISEASARDDCGLSDADIAKVMEQVRLGQKI